MWVKEDAGWFYGISRRSTGRLMKPREGGIFPFFARANASRDSPKECC